MIPPKLTRREATEACVSPSCRAATRSRQISAEVSIRAPRAAISASAIGAIRGVCLLGDPAIWLPCRAERSGRLPVAPAEHLDLSIECRRRAWLITQDRLQSFADLLINCRTVGVIDVNSVAHGDILTRSKPKQVSGAETAAIGYLRERLC